MSRIFDALQHSNAEGNGFEFPLELSVSAELPQATAVETKDVVTDEFAQFPSVPLSTSPSSRLVSLTDQASLGAEEFRFLGVRLRRIRQSRSLKRLLITSTIPGEGKTTVSANLAVSLAQRRPQKVLLLEGDLRRPVLSARFGLSSVPGLSEWLEGGHKALPTIYRLEDAEFWFLPAGRPPANPLELLQSDRLGDLVNRLSDWFDWILIDSPPVAPLADTSVWMRAAEGILMVAREGATPKRQLERALRDLEQSKLLGVVLNSSCNTDRKNYYQRYGPVSPNSAAK